MYRLLKVEQKMTQIVPTMYIIEHSISKNLLVLINKNPDIVINCSKNQTNHHANMFKYLNIPLLSSGELEKPNPNDYTQALDKTIGLFDEMNKKHTILFLGDTYESIYVLLCAIYIKFYGTGSIGGLKVVREIIKQQKISVPITHYVIQTVRKIEADNSRGDIKITREEKWNDFEQIESTDDFGEWKEIDQFVESVDGMDEETEIIKEKILVVPQKKIIEPIETKTKTKTKTKITDDEYRDPIPRGKPMKLIDDEYDMSPSFIDFDNKTLRYSNEIYEDVHTKRNVKINEKSSYDEKLAYIIDQSGSENIDTELIISLLINNVSVHEIILSSK